VSEADAEIAVDASAVLALLQGERFGAFDAERIVGAWISAVNFSEVLAKLRDGGLSEDEADQAVDGLDFRIVPFDASLARATAWLLPSTRRAGLSLGDRACLATAAALGASAATADRAWARLDVGTKVELIR